jgi:isoquinoline 1-oxidoreductase beta subunit
VRTITRRVFLSVGAVGLAGAGLLVGVGGWAGRSRTPEALKKGAGPTETVFNAWLKIDADGQVTIIQPRAEMGQGIQTSLPIMVAEELDADWQKVHIGQSPIDGMYANFNLQLGDPWDGGATGAARKIGTVAMRLLNFDVTGGSASTRDAWEPLRTAGAISRVLLLRAAAAEWQVPVETLRTESGFVIDAQDRRRLDYGHLAAAAAKLAPPTEVTVKTPEQFRLIGTQQPRRDIPSKVNGQAEFGIDAAPEHRLYAAVRPCPYPGGALREVRNEALTQAQPGIVAIVRLERAVAVIADQFWRAKKAVEALEVQWATNGAETITDEGLRLAHRQALEGKARTMAGGEDAEMLLRQSPRVLMAEYDAPYLPHLCMEPISCTVRVENGKAEVWTGTQAPGLTTQAVAKGARVAQGDVTLHKLYLGGGFGRKAETEMALAAGQIAARVPGRPVKVIWTREADIAADLFRPMSFARLRVALDTKGHPAAYSATAAVGSITRNIARRALGGAPSFIPDSPSVEGLGNEIYDLGKIHLRHADVETAIPITFWRSVGFSQNTFFLESFVDEWAAAAGHDPLQYRRDIARNERVVKLIEQLREISNWNTPLASAAPGTVTGRGVAVCKAFGSYCGQTATVTVKEDGTLTVDTVHAVVDCGTTIQPGTVRAQMEGGIIFGLSAAWFHEITFVKGQAIQTGMANFPLVQMANAPVISVSIMPNHEPPGGVGEVAVPLIAPAVANAVFAATGIRIRSLPFAKHDLSRKNWRSAEA